MKRYPVFIFTILINLTGCGTITRMTNLVNESTQSIYDNAEAVNRSTDVIRQNAYLVDESTKAIVENRHLIEEASKS